MALLRAKPGGYSYGSPGVGTAHHLLVELIRRARTSRPLHVPYLGSVKAMVDLAEGRFDFMFLDATVALPPDRRRQDQGAGRHRQRPAIRRCRTCRR